MDELKSLETTRLRRPAARGALGRSFPYLVYGERAAKEGGRAGVRLPLGVLGMIALIGVVETAIALAAPRLRDPVSFSWVYAAEAAKHRAPGSGILCLGDSLAKDGLVSAVLTATTGVPTYNLSAPAAPAPMTECLFRRALDAGARPRAIVLELKPSLLAGGPRYRMRGWQEFLNFSETVSLIRSAAQHLVRHRSSSRADPAEPSRALRNSRGPAPGCKESRRFRVSRISSMERTGPSTPARTSPPGTWHSPAE